MSTLIPLDVPVGWSDPDPVSALTFIVLLVGIPLLAFAVIALLVYVPSLARGESVRPGAQPEDQWLGGPSVSGGGSPAELGGPADDTGGASGKW